MITTYENGGRILPDNCFYLQKVVQFSDFETPQIEITIAYSDSKKELERYCAANKYELTGPWSIYSIRRVIDGRECRVI